MRKTMTNGEKEDKDKEENEDNDKEEWEDDDTVACVFVCLLLLRLCCFVFISFFFCCFALVFGWCFRI